MYQSLLTCSNPKLKKVCGIPVSSHKVIMQQKPIKMMSNGEKIKFPANVAQETGSPQRIKIGRLKRVIMSWMCKKEMNQSFILLSMPCSVKKGRYFSKEFCYFLA